MKKSKGSSVALSSYATPTTSSSQRTTVSTGSTSKAASSSSPTTGTALSSKPKANNHHYHQNNKASSSQSALSLQDLPEDEKLKVSRLVEKLIELGNKHEETLQQLHNERQEHQMAMNTLQHHLEGQLSIIEDNMKIKDQKIIALETKENLMSAMLVLYQSKLRNMNDIYLLTKHHDQDSKEKYQLLEQELQHFQKVVNTQKTMIDSFDETKRQLELSYQLTIKSLQEKVQFLEKQVDDEKKMRNDYENQIVQIRTKNSLLEHELLTMQTQLQTVLTVTAKSTAATMGSGTAVSAALTTMNSSNESASSSVSSSISSANGLMNGGNSTAGNHQEEFERLQRHEKLRETFRNGGISNNNAILNANIPPPPPATSGVENQFPQTTQAAPNRNAIFSSKPTVFTGTAVSSGTSNTGATAMVSGGTQTNDGHYDDYSVMYNSSIDSSMINFHTLSVHDPKDEGNRHISTLVGADENESLMPTASDSPIRRKRSFKLGGLLKVQTNQQDSTTVNSSDEFSSRPLIKANDNNDSTLKKATVSSATGMVATVRRKPARIPTTSSFVISSREGGLNESVESVDSMSSPPLEYSPITPGTVFKNLQHPKSGRAQAVTNSLRNSQASAVSTDDPNSVYSSMYGDSEETTMSTIDNSLDLNNSSLDILYPLSHNEDSNKGSNSAPVHPATTSVDLNPYLELPSAIEPVNQNVPKPKTKGIAVMDTPSPSPHKQSYSLLAQLRPNTGSIIKRSTSAPPSQRRRENGTSAGDDEVNGADHTQDDKHDSNPSNSALNIKKVKKSSSIFDLFDGKDTLKQQDQQSSMKKASTLSTSTSHITPTSSTRQHKSISFDDNVISHHNSAHNKVQPQTHKKSTPSPPQASSSSTLKHNSIQSPTTASIKVSIPTVNTIKKETHRKETILNPKKSSPATQTVSKKMGTKKISMEDVGNLYDDSLFDLLEDLD